MWQRRLLFSAIFVLGTLVAVFGWIAQLREVRKAALIAAAGHGLQVVGIFGNMITPDAVEEEPLGSGENGDEESDGEEFGKRPPQS